MSGSLVTTIRFKELHCQVLIDRVERSAFVMDYESADHLGALVVSDGQLLWRPIDRGAKIPLAIVSVVQSMIGGEFDLRLVQGVE